MNSINYEMKIVLASVSETKIWRYLDSAWLKKKKKIKKKKKQFSWSQISLMCMIWHIETTYRTLRSTETDTQEIECSFFNRIIIRMLHQQTALINLERKRREYLKKICCFYYYIIIERKRVREQRDYEDQHQKMRE